MATTRTRTATNDFDFDAATSQFRELNERVAEASKKAGNLYVDAWEKTVTGFAALEEKVAGASRVDWVTDVVGAHANLTRDFGRTYAAGARDLLK